MTFVAVAIASAFTAIVSAAEVPRWKEEWLRAVEAAKREGQVSLYGGQEITHPDIIAAFNKEFPFIKVLTTSGRGGDLVARIISERRADKYLVDVIATGPNGPRMLYLAKALDPIAPALIPSRRSRMCPSGTVESTGMRIPRINTSSCSKVL